VTRPLIGGCHINRPIEDLIEGASFKIETLKKGYEGNLRPFVYMYEGIASLN
jgi:hypothetical protein